ncbi:peptidase MA family metallohydrolase [Kutzneria albida]|uniref:Peptidase MA-like domain-containing protein n=1 Tax=Kutzneria albida DSM 43870 TaxID=1449976 RepID=W5W4F0_9PSEU|nr:hypothetical protein [Kutzneria albida]AHH95351.1 hypothetical protein KALB_1981 [Kutzneria albida DSM 43870]
MARFRAWLVAAVALALLGAVVLLLRQPVAGPLTPALTTPSVQAAPALTDTRTAAVTELLRRRSDAVLHRDRAEFLSTVDPQASPEFRAAQRSLFDNLDGVPLSAWTYRLDPNQVSQAPTAFSADELWAPQVDLNYSLAGVDPGTTAKPMAYLFARRGQNWYLASDSTLSHQTWRGPWDFGPLVLLRAANGFVLAHPGNADLGRRIAAELDADVRAVSQVWGKQWPQRVAVLLPDSSAELKALVGPEFAVDAIAAVAVADRVDHASRSAVGQRVVLNPANAGKLSATSLSVVLRHEMTHIAARGVTVDGTPMWLLEGFADYVGYRDSGVPMPQAAAEVARLVRAGTPPTELPSNADFAAGGGRINLAYQEAWTVNQYVAETFGQPALVRLYQRVAGGDPKAPLDDALREVLGVDTQGLVRGWQEYLRAEL